MKFLKIFTVLVVLGLGLYLFLTIQWGPYGEGGLVYIPKGMTVEQIGETLAQEKIVRNAWSFKLLVRLKGESRYLQAGEYKFPSRVSTAEVLEKLRKGQRYIRRLTIPEGYNFQQIAQEIEKTGIASASEVQALFKDPRYLNKLGFNALSLEGYLFPDTYEYNRGTTLDDIISQMIANFKKQIGEGLSQRAQQGGWTIPQLTTLASVIEKETGLAAERPRIASVFQNRLQIGMPLQSDPTIIYGLKDYQGDIRRKDIRNPHPYNTYVHVGLPPGPIASPGIDSLRAVLNPEPSDYLFFVSRGDGSHQFSENLAEHQAAVRKYQLGRKPETMPETSPTQP